MVTTSSSGRRALVTGATGLLGSHLTKALLKRGTEVIALVHDIHPQSIFALENLGSRVKIVEGSLEDMAALERAIVQERADTVYHLGALTLVQDCLRSPLQAFETNIRGTYNLLEICRTNPSIVQRVLCASSDKAYGTSPTLPYTEEMPLHGMHPYDVSKSCMDLLSQTYAYTYGLPLCVVRCGNIYGPGDVNWSRLIPGTVRSMLQKKVPEIRSDGTYVRDYLYVEDIVDGYLRIADAMKRPDVRGQAFNLGPNAPLSVLDVVRAILVIMGEKALQPKILDTATHEIHDQYLSGEKAYRLLGWTARHSLEEGLRKTIPWYAEIFREEMAAMSA
jgi:CDP-glucose 4,6-dehydratase